MSIMTKASASFKKDGLRGLIVSICHFLIRHCSKSNTTMRASENRQEDSHALKLDPSSRYWFVNDSPFGQHIHPQDIDPDTINWLVPAFENSSGGHLTIFRLIRDMENLGFKNRIVFEHNIKGKTVEEVRALIKSNFLPIDCPISFGADSLAPAYFTFATNWTTAYLLRNFISTIEKCYILQDYEPYFYPRGTDYYLAERTYGFGFKTFAGGDWLVNQLKSKHNVTAAIFPFGCDHALYTPAAQLNKPHGTKTLLFYARPSTPRRGFELGMLAFEKLLAKLNNVQILLAGCDLSAYELPANIKSVGIVPMSELPQLYRNCDVALIISFTNVSLLPLDLMASGCTVVSNSGPQVEWLLNDQIAMLSEADPDSLFLALEKILTDDNLRQQKIKAASHFVAGQHWTIAAKLIADNLRQTQKYCQERQMSVIS